MTRSRTTARSLAAVSLPAVLLGLTGLSGLFLVSCSDDELTAEGFIQQYPQAYCDYLYRCCSGAERSVGSKTQCQQRATDEVETLLAFHEDPAPKATFASVSAEQCLSKLAGECGPATEARDCLQTAARATGSQGDDCKHNSECPNRYCLISAGTDQGACAGKSTVGGGCSGDDRACPDGHYCSTAKVCTAQKNVADPCSAGNECTSGVCSPSDKICAGVTDPFCDGA